MRVWRICRRRWSTTAFSGEGARRAGGRWNHKGNAIVYTSDSLALATLEFLVGVTLRDAPDDLVAIAATIPDSVAVRRIAADELPPDWRSYPAPLSTKEIGTAWLQGGKSTVLVVPSVVIPEENNVLLNPAHAGMARVQIDPPRPFPLDPRLWQAATS